MSDIIEEFKAVVKDNEQVENYLRTGMMPISFKRIKELIAEVEKLTKERDELKKEDTARNDWRLTAQSQAKKISILSEEIQNKRGLLATANNTCQSYSDEITALKAENAEWVAKSHAWLTASMAQDDEITTLKAKLEAWEDRVNTDGAMWAHQRKDLEQQLAESEKKVEEYETSNSDLEESVDEVVRELNEVASKLAESEKKAEELGKRVRVWSSIEGRYI